MKLLLYIAFFSLYINCNGTHSGESQAVSIAKKFVESLMTGNAETAKSISINYRAHRHRKHWSFLYKDVHEQIDKHLENREFWINDFDGNWSFELLESYKLKNDDYFDLKEAYVVIYKCKANAYSSVTIGLDDNSSDLKVVDFESGCRIYPGGN